jgi:hypothetical protein
MVGKEVAADQPGSQAGRQGLPRVFLRAWLRDWLSCPLLQSTPPPPSSSRHHGRFTMICRHSSPRAVPCGGADVAVAAKFNKLSKAWSLPCGHNNNGTDECECTQKRVVHVSVRPMGLPARHRQMSKTRLPRRRLRFRRRSQGGRWPWRGWPLCACQSVCAAAVRRRETIPANRKARPTTATTALSGSVVISPPCATATTQCTAASAAHPVDVPEVVLQLCHFALGTRQLVALGLQCRKRR